MSDNEAVFRNLIVKAQSGDQLAYGELLKALRLFLSNYLRKKIFEKSDIEEVTQEILLAIHKSLHTYNPEKLFMSWALAITEYKIIDYIRSLSSLTTELSDDTVKRLFIQTEMDSNLKIDLEKALDKLSAREKQILQLLKIEGQSTKAVAEQMNLSESNIKVIAHRAYVNLKVYLGEQR